MTNFYCSGKSERGKKEEIRHSCVVTREVGVEVCTERWYYVFERVGKDTVNKNLMNLSQSDQYRYDF